MLMSCYVLQSAIEDACVLNATMFAIARENQELTYDSFILFSLIDTQESSCTRYDLFSCLTSTAFNIHD